jgi:hypothetical protein
MGEGASIDKVKVVQRLVLCWPLSAVVRFVSLYVDALSVGMLLQALCCGCSCGVVMCCAWTVRNAFVACIHHHWTMLLWLISLAGGNGGML